MHVIKYNKIRFTKYISLQVWNSYMFWHRGAILRDFSRTREYISELIYSCTNGKAKQIQHTGLGMGHPQNNHYNINVLKYI